MTLEEKADKLAEDYVMREDTITENDRVPFYNGYGFQTVDFEKEVKKGYKDGYLAGAKENQQVIEEAVEIIRMLGSIVREGVTCHVLYDDCSLHRATLFLKEYAK